ncbi:MAG: hypothetical protein M9897_01970 [Brumimicrobium sp.]|nr:hypothetical protein [Brumimicrobium sp.]
MLEFDLEQSKQIHDYGTAAGAGILLSDIFLIKRNAEIANIHLNESRKFITLSKQSERLTEWFPIMSKWQAQFGDRELASIYIDSTTFAINHKQDEFNVIQLLKAQQKIDRHNQLLKETQFGLQNQKRINQLYLLIIIIILLTIFILLRHLINKRKKQQIIIEKLRIENDLKEAQFKINQFIIRIEDQIAINEKLQNQFKNFQSYEQNDNHPSQETISNLKSTKILTDDDWISFKYSFEKIYPNFITKLKDKFPTITEAECRYLMLSLLNLSHKEMAYTLGISNSAIRVTWNRVRKKMNGNIDDTPQSLIDKI